VSAKVVAEAQRNLEQLTTILHVPIELLRLVMKAVAVQMRLKEQITILPEAITPK
jgi:hypothetical protein